MTFRVGMKVVCVNAVWVDPRWRDCPNKPVERGIYTVRAIMPNWFLSGISALLLEEISNSIILWEKNGYSSEWGFSPHRFRPLAETDISIFKRMLTDQKVEA